MKSEDPSVPPSLPRPQASSCVLTPPTSGLVLQPRLGSPASRQPGQEVRSRV